MDKELKVLGPFRSLPGERRTETKESKNNDYLIRQKAYESNAKSYPQRLPFALAQAKGIYLKDMDGDVYFDCFSCAGTLALGHNPETVHEAIRNSLDLNLPMQTLDITTQAKEDLVKEILSSFPKEFADNAKVHFCSPSGSDAVEAALKLVKIATGRRSIIAFHGAYHGMTGGPQSLMGNTKTKGDLPGSMSEVHFMPYPYSYRCTLGNCADKCQGTCSRYLEDVLTDDESGLSKPAGIILEAVQGEGGKIVAPNAWMQHIRKITKEQGIPLIIDEVQTGMGRTGKMFAFEHSGIIPDVVILAKAIGGSLPLAVIVYHKDLDKWRPGSHCGTFRGNQLGIAAGTATIRYIKENKVLENVISMGNLFKDRFRVIQAEFTCLGDIRGRGLMLGIEIVNPKTGNLQSGRPERHEKLARLIQYECFMRGLIVETGGRLSSVIRFMPPLTITENQTNQICDIFRNAVFAAEKTLLFQRKLTMA